MDVGVNYPWLDYGWDFGDAPRGWRHDSDPRWTTFIDLELQSLHSLGIRVVRWFVFCDGLAYGNGNEAPYQNRDGKWCFGDPLKGPPKLSESFRRHFRKLLERFSVANQRRQPPIRLLPVLLDYKFCQDGYNALRTPQMEWIRGGRNDVVIKPQMSQNFFECALSPLLDISKDHRNAIFAWDIFNEPEWVTNDWHPDGTRGLPASAQQMRQFLQAAIDRVQSADFRATIGFNRIETIRSTKLYACYNQFHHYARNERKLEQNKFDKQSPGIVGEFATSLNGDIWPELPKAQTVYHRLKHVEKMGYSLALPWAIMSTDRDTSWRDGEEGIRQYLGKK